MVKGCSLLHVSFHCYFHFHFEICFCFWVICNKLSNKPGQIRF